MRILYNPPVPQGADINEAIYNGELKDPHPAKSFRQYLDQEADFMLETYPFLQEKSPEEAQKMIEESKAKETMSLKCEYCDFATDKEIALQGHLRKHKEEIAKKAQPAIDPSIVPISSGKKKIRENP